LTPPSPLGKTTQGKECATGDSGAAVTGGFESTRVTKQMLKTCRFVAQVDDKYLLATCDQMVRTGYAQLIEGGRLDSLLIQSLA
jgi:hypothetical protein